MAKGNPPQNPKQIQDSAEARAQLAQVEAEQLDILERTTRATEELTESESKLLLIDAELASLRKDYVEAIKAGNTANDEAIKGTLSRRDAVLKLIKSEKDLSDSEDALADKLQGSANTLLQTTLGINTQGNAITGLVGQMAKGSKASDIMSKAFGGLKGKAFLANAAFGVATGVMQKFTEATVSAFMTSQQLEDSLGREAGLMTEGGQVDALLKMSQNSDNAHVSFERLGGAVRSMQEATKGLFGNLLETNQQLPLFAAEMHGLGVETSTTAELFGQFGMILGKDGINQVRRLETQTILLARTMGLNSDAMVKDVASMAESLAEFGDQSDDIALDMAKIAGATKISSKSMLGFTDSFAYFPDAIAKAREMNLIFGRSVIDGDKMFKMMQDGALGPGAVMRETLRSIGENIDETFLNSPAKMRALAKQFGGNALEARRFAETALQAQKTVGGLDAMIEKSAGSLEKRNKAMKIQENLTQSLAKLQQMFALSMEPVVNLLERFVNYLNSIDPETLRTIFAVIGGVGAVAGGALSGAAAGSIIPGAGTLAGAIAGGVAGLAGVGTVAALNDGIITVSGDKVTAAPINSADDVTVMAKKPGGPLAEMGIGGTATGPTTIQLTVDLFGERLIKKMVDLVSNEQALRATIQDVVQGG